jgi:hypothetical protein
LARQERTKGYALRLRWAVEEGPKAMSVRRLADGLGRQYPKLRGTSYGGVRQYAENKVKRPRVELLRAMADMLGVRGDWLAFGDGEPTEHLDYWRRAARSLAESGMTPEKGAPPAERLRDAVREALGRQSPYGGQVEESMPPWVPMLSPVWFELVNADAKARPAGVGVTLEDVTNLERAIGEALAAPLRAIRVDAASLTERDLTRYVVSMIPALLSVAARRKVHIDDATRPAPRAGEATPEGVQERSVWVYRAGEEGPSHEVDEEGGGEEAR